MATVVAIGKPKVQIECGEWRFNADYYRFMGLCPLWARQIDDSKVLKLTDTYDLLHVQKFFQFVNTEAEKIDIPQNLSAGLLKMSIESGYTELTKILQDNQKKAIDPSRFELTFGTKEQIDQFLQGNNEDKDLYEKEKLIAMNINKALKKPDFICNMSLDQLDRIIFQAVTIMRNKESDINDKDKLNIHELVSFIITMNNRKKSHDYSALLSYFSISEITLEDMKELIKCKYFDFDFIKPDVNYTFSLDQQIKELKEIIQKQAKEIKEMKEMKEIIQKQAKEITEMKEIIQKQAKEITEMKEVKEIIQKQAKEMKEMKELSQKQIDATNEVIKNLRQESYVSFSEIEKIIDDHYLEKAENRKLREKMANVTKTFNNSFLFSHTDLVLYQNETDNYGFFSYFKDIMGETELNYLIDLKGTSNNNQIAKSTDLMAICGPQSSKAYWQSGNFPNSCIFIDFKEMKFRFKQIHLRNPQTGTNFIKSCIVEGKNTSEAAWEKISSWDASNNLSNVESVASLGLNNFPNKYYKFIQFRLNGLNHNQNNIISLSGFEIFGNIKKE